MKRFRFALQRILELRERVEEEARIALGRAVGELTLIEQRIASVAEERRRAMGERFAPGNDFTDIQTYERYLNRLDRTREGLLQDAARAELVAAEKRDAFTEASRERKVLDRLRERRFGEYRKYVRSEEYKETDESARRRAEP